MHGTIFWTLSSVKSETRPEFARGDRLNDVEQLLQVICSEAHGRNSLPMEEEQV